MFIIYFPWPCTDTFTAVGLFIFHDDSKNTCIAKLQKKAKKKKVRKFKWTFRLKSNYFAQSGG